MPDKPRSSARWLENSFPLAFGCFLGLCLLKFGNPPVTEYLVSPPANFYELLLASPWPVRWAYGLMSLLILLFAFSYFRFLQSERGFQSSSTASATPRSLVTWLLLLLPVIWIVWQFLGLSRSVDHPLSIATLKHFTATLACFYLGYFGLARSPRPILAAPGLLLCLGFVMVSGFEQHFGGLAEARRYFYLYVYPKEPGVPAELIKKFSSTRIFGTLFYPNSLAGVLLLLLPASVALLLHRKFTIFTFPARAFLAGVFGIAGLACLAWSGSKGGWLLMLLLAVLMLLRLPVPRVAKKAVIVLLLLGGLAGFGWKYHAFFQKGATSVGARFDYWRAALQIARQHPLFGTGAGTFGIPYAQVKKRESEMARLTHNDFLEQASDGGVIPFLAYAAFIVLALMTAYKAVPSRSEDAKNQDYLPYATFLGLVGWGAQSLFEFSLYIPALSWTAFAILGYLCGTSDRQSSQKRDYPSKTEFSIR